MIILLLIFPVVNTSYITYNYFYRGGCNMAVNKDKYTQILVTFTKEQVEQIENYWHENKLKNRNEAIRQIVDKGLSRK